MRILHLLPATASGRARLDEALALAAALEARGHRCASWSPNGPGEVAVVELKTFAHGLTDIDLIHNHAGLWPLACLADAKLPIVTSLHAAPGPTERAFVATLTPPPTFVACGVTATAMDRSALSPLRVATELKPGLAVEATVAVLESLYAKTLERWRTHLANTRFDERPWGRYWVLDDQPTFKVKRITVDPGQRLSYQRHKRRAEHWLFVAGRSKVTLDGVDTELGPGQDVRIPAGTAHRIENLGSEPATFVELQRGDYFGEDDIERLSDDYGRTPD